MHQNWKDAIVSAAETDTLMLNRRHSPALRVMRTEKTSGLEYSEENVMGTLGSLLDLYFGGDMEASIALTGQVAGRIDAVRPVADILDDIMSEFHDTLSGLADTYLALASANSMNRSTRSAMTDRLDRQKPGSARSMENADASSAAGAIPVLDSRSS